MHPLPFYLTETGAAGSGANHGTNGSSPGSIRQQLDAAAAEAAARGIPVRGLLITNPNNPLGTIYSEATIVEMLRWCLDNKVHYIRWGAAHPAGAGGRVAPGWQACMIGSMHYSASLLLAICRYLSSSRPGTMLATLHLCVSCSGRSHAAPC